jgi:hypothetical protein
MKINVQRSPFAVRRSPFAVRRSPFTVHRSPFAVGWAQRYEPQPDALSGKSRRLNSFIGSEAGRFSGEEAERNAFLSFV